MTIPEGRSSKRPRSELELVVKARKFEFQEAKEKVRPTHSLDVNYWTSAAAACQAKIQLLDAETKLAVEDWNTKEQPAKSWCETKKARRIVEEMKTATLEKSLCNQQAERISEGGHIRRNFQAMFTTSQLGICAEKVGFGSRKNSAQSRFMKELIDLYDVGQSRPDKPKSIILIQDAATGLYLGKDLIVAAHLFPYRLGPDVLMALFGKNVENELMSVRT